MKSKVEKGKNEKFVNHCWTLYINHYLKNLQG